ncbi:MAG TPA: hypothetical protein VKY74_02145 [Chloroflexia bacterium]|nr:hypothetical protein [Chloroflexia bacterium]
MRKLQFGAGLLLLSLMLGLLAACGGDTSTATSVPKPTATTAPPTATTAPPTATTAPPTATTASAATAAPAEATNTPAAALGGTAATADDLAMITQSFTATANLKSFHYIITSGGTTITQPTNLEGDYVAPNQLYGKGTQHGVDGEFLKVGTASFKKDASGTWAPWTDPSTTTPPQTPQDDWIKSFNGFVGLAGATDFRDTGTPETLDGVSTRHFVGQIAINKMAGMPDQLSKMTNLPPAGTFEVWIDPQTKYLYKAQLSLDVGAVMNAVMSQLQTPVPGAPTATAGPANTQSASVILTKLNDPSITVPAGPAGGTDMTATPGSAPGTDTPAAAPTATP